ncbi:helix-turn-helix domain-containing protein [Pelagicoccus albus]|uniref:Helix-turn-helix domain-containing protein n=1 Tax=Pelagicoccus albus TaxID=415222 RepID=A0A7X1B327_9BACT|nr:helix-turn-helix domain-containing protein [Pelagicoccus albus]
MPSNRASSQKTPIERATAEESKELTSRISSSRMFIKFQRSFSRASGLPLVIRPLSTFSMPTQGHAKENPFCSFVSTSRKGCLSCLMSHSDLEQTTLNRTKTHRCFAGLHDSMVPIRTGRKLIAHLQTGQVALESLGTSDFQLVSPVIDKLGLELPPKKLKSAYLTTRVLPKENYLGFLNLLELFADQLGSSANNLRIQKAEKTSNPAAARAVKHIKSNFELPISLSEIAEVAGTSVRHFSKVFKEETGLSFVEYLTRERVEKAKKQIRESSNRISDIAFESGFDSIAQFNRAFKKVAGESPSSYRLSANS